jgi:hypothetical protein
MNAPDRKLDSVGIGRLLPGEYMLIDAVDQRAVEIKQKGVLGAHRVPDSLSSSSPGSSRRTRLEEHGRAFLSEMAGTSPATTK